MLYSQSMTNPRVFLNKKEEEEILQGFPWVFDNEIAFVKAENNGKIEQTPLKEEGFITISVQRVL